MGDAEPNFETMRSSFEPFPFRVVDPPAAVMVDLGLIVGGLENQWADRVPLRVKAQALQFDSPSQGLLLAWVRSSRGAWIALVEVAVPTGNGNGFLMIRQWVSSLAVQPHSAVG
jgi:hypothetical protein